MGAGGIWTVLAVLEWAKDFFAGKNMETPRLDAEVLLADALSVDRVSLYTNWNKPLDPGELERFRNFVRKRADGCPAAYLLGKKEFMSIEFRLTDEVSIPRPETEFVVEAVLDAFEKDAAFLAADLCTGSGNVAVSIAHFRPNAEVIATDVSVAALDAAQKNAQADGCAERVEFREGAMFEALAGFDGKLDALACNPPYVSEAEFAALPAGIREYEPARAFLAGEDGLDFIRELADKSAGFLKKGGLLAFEIGHTQAADARELVEQSNGFENIKVIKDYSRLDRVLCATRR